LEVNQPQPLCRESDTKRFYKQVEVVESGCHEWTGRINSSGYGIIYFNKKQQAAHRVAWQIANGEIPKGMLVCHTCDNPPCVNVNHLWLGTHQDNMDDMTVKGRDANSQKTHCSNGHPYDKENTRITIRTGSQLQLNRHCITCSIAYRKQYVKDNRELIKIKRFANREKKIEYLREYRAKNRTKLNAEKIKYYYAHRDEILKKRHTQLLIKKN
jgi:hypothetical protein